MSALHPDELVLGKVIRSITSIDKAMGLHILDILGIAHTTTIKEFFALDKLEQWRKLIGIPNQDKFREELISNTYYKHGQKMSLQIFAKDVEFPLRSEIYIFPEEMCMQLDEWHRECGWADYLQCNAKCTRCEFPCPMSAKFLIQERIAQTEPKTPAAAQPKKNRHKHPVTFQEKLMQTLNINDSKAIHILNLMRLKKTVLWAQMQNSQFGAYWREFVWDSQSERKLAVLGQLLGPKKSEKLAKLLLDNVHEYVEKPFVPDEIIINRFN